MFIISIWHSASVDLLVCECKLFLSVINWKSSFTLLGGMLEAPVLTYVAEIAQPKIRGMLSATGSTCIILGIFSQFLMANFFEWRAITIVSSCIPIIAIILLCFVPESPHWLILRNRKEEAKKSLMWLRGWQENFSNVKYEFEDLCKNLEKPNVGDEGKKEHFIREFTKRTFLFPYFICSLSFFIGKIQKKCKKIVKKITLPFRSL